MVGQCHTATPHRVSTECTSHHNNHQHHLPIVNYCASSRLRLIYYLKNLKGVGRQRFHFRTIPLDDGLGGIYGPKHEVWIGKKGHLNTERGYAIDEFCSYQHRWIWRNMNGILHVLFAQNVYGKSCFLNVGVLVNPETLQKAFLLIFFNEGIRVGTS
jgi:hypothetical protein